MTRDSLIPLGTKVSTGLAEFRSTYYYDEENGQYVMKDWNVRQGVKWYEGVDPAEVPSYMAHRLAKKQKA